MSWFEGFKSRKEDIKKCDSVGKFVLEAYWGSLTNVKEAIEKYNVSVNGKNPSGNTALHEACKGNEYDIASYLLSKGADPNIQTNDGYTALHIASKKSDKEIVSLLLDHGVDKNITDKFGYTACSRLGYGDNDVKAMILKHNSGEFEKVENRKLLARVSMLLTACAISFGGTYNIVTEDLETSGSPKQTEVMELFQGSAQTLIAQHNEIRGAEYNHNIAETVNGLGNIDWTENTNDIDNSGEDFAQLTRVFNENTADFFDLLALDANVSEQDKAGLIEKLGNSGIDILDYTVQDEVNPEYLNECRVSTGGTSANDIYECTDRSDSGKEFLVLLVGTLGSLALNFLVAQPVANSNALRKLVRPKRKAKNY